MTLLQVRNVTKAFEGKEVLKGVDLEIKKGGIYGLLGRNGAGKTTLLQILAGLVDMNEGIIKVDSYDLVKDPHLAKRELGYVPDQPFLYEYLTGKEYLEFIAGLWELDNPHKKISELLSLFILEKKATSLISTYSFGMKQKLATAGALLTDPKVMVLDEPFTGFDPPSVKLMKDFFQDYASQGNALLFSTHLVDVAKNYCDRIGILRDGKIRHEFVDLTHEDVEVEIIHSLGEEA